MEMKNNIALQALMETHLPLNRSIVVVYVLADIVFNFGDFRYSGILKSGI
jgi:hypothetical protein